MEYFANIVRNCNFETIKEDFINICAIINAFRPQIASTNDEDKALTYHQMVDFSHTKKTNLPPALKITLKEF